MPTPDDTHLALVNIAAPDGEPAIDDSRNAEDEAEHHDDGEAVADAGLEVGGIEAGAAARLCERGNGVENENRGDIKDGGTPRTNFRSDMFD